MGRVLTFANPDVIRLAQTQFIPVTADDWYQRRRQDAEGDFFRKVADQGPRHGQGGSTRQGMYVFTASGKLLAYRNHESPEVMRAELYKALKAWKQLPSEERNPGAVKVEEWTKIDDRFNRKPPKDALVVNVYTRILAKNTQGEYEHTSCKFVGGERAAHDHLWIPADEWRQLTGENPKMPERLALRLARFHLVDNTRGEPPAWKLNHVKRSDFNVSPTSSSKRPGWKIEGSLFMKTDADAKMERGFEVRLLGTIELDAKGKVATFDLVALGEHWGESKLTPMARPGRQPLGIAFELASGDAPADRIPPQFARNWREYLEAEK